MSVMSSQTADAFSSLLQTRAAVLADVDLDSAPEERLLVRSDLSGTMQLYELRREELVELTALPEPVAGAHYIPGSAARCWRSTRVATSATSSTCSTSRRPPMRR